MQTEAPASDQALAVAPSTSEPPKLLNARAVRRRVERIRGMNDNLKMRQAQRRLMRQVLTEIAAGRARSPARLAEAALELFAEP